MADEQDTLREEEQDARLRRLRAALIVIIVAAFLGLIGLAVFVFQLVQPPGAPAAGDVPEGLTWIRSIYGMSARPADQFQGPTDVAIGPDGKIWVTESSRNRIMGFNPDGSFVRQLSAGPVAQAGGSKGGMVSVPSGIVVDAQNRVYVANFGSSLVLVFDSTNGSLIKSIKVPFPQKIALRDTRLFITSTEGLFVFTTDGKQVTKFSSRGSKNDQVDLPQGAVIGQDGTLIVSDTHNVQIKAFSSQGKLLWANPKLSARVGGSAGATGGPDARASTDATGSTDASGAAGSPTALAASLQLPMGLTVDGAGRLVFVDPFAFAIYVADQKDGTIRASYGEQGSRDGQFNYPAGIAYDPARDWFAVADAANARVQIVRIAGSGDTALAAARRIQGPVWLCSVPLILLLLALVVAVVRRRRRSDIAPLAESDEIDDENNAEIIERSRF